MTQECQQKCNSKGRKRRDVDMEDLNVRKKRDIEEVSASDETVDVETCDIIYRKKETCFDTVCPGNSTCLQVRALI